MTKFTKILIILLIAISLCVAIKAQTSPGIQTTEKPKRVVFRATKNQILEAQRLLKARAFYGGGETGKLDGETRAGLRRFQEAEGLPATGTLNRITLEKMNIELTERQKTMPAQPPPQAGTVRRTGAGSPRAPVFRASKDQITAAQKMLKEKGFYAGAETGKLDDATRAGLKKFQIESGIRATGTLNRETLEKMGIALTDRQREM